MKIALFLGAGASVPFGKPTTTHLKKKLFDEYNKNAGPQFLSKFLDFEAYPDMEYILQSVKENQGFLRSQGGKFFSHAGLGLYFHTYGSQIPFQNFVNSLSEIEEILENKIFENYSWNHKYDNELKNIYGEIFELAKISEDFRVITTNYDRAIEEFCSGNSDLRIVDGFKLNIETGRFLWNNGDFEYVNDNKIKPVKLYKLHGSLNWKKHTKYGFERTSEEWKPNDPNYEENMLIYPTLSPKDGYVKEPYRTIREKFLEYMKEADICIVIGFSFRDEHVNEILLDFIKKGKKLMVISRSGYKLFHLNLLKEDLAKEDSTDETTKRTGFMKETKEHGIIGAEFIHKNLEVGTVKEIVHDIKREIKPNEHPF